jgi:putative sigma-54 modulation protein
MKIKSSFRNFEHTPSLDEKINLKSKKLEKFFDGNVELHWTCSVPEGGKHWAEIKILGPNFEYHASAHSDTMYKSLDLVIQKVQKQVVKKKDKWRNHISQKHKSSVKKEQMSQSEWDEQYWENLNTDLAS